ncbi:MAG TPA: hypothetical protein VK171_00750 [Fimbriimonas sp.]|nr:hypothetical protein [Fimbriimonas sp.]
MQDRYAGDVGDFSKFALMRTLQSLSDQPLGLIWYKHPDESHTNDGKHIDYVRDHRWTACDSELVNLMNGVILRGDRKIAALEALPLFSNGARYVDSLVPKVALARAAWFADVKQRVKPCEVVFVDPDNGIRLRGHAKTSAKHIHQDEFEALANGCDVLVSYHHFDRSCSHPDQMRRLVADLQSDLPHHKIEVLRYRRISPRAYVCAVRKLKAESFDQALATITSHPWNFHFERFVG